MILTLGINRGLKTLYVNSYRVTFMELEKALRNNPDVEHVYFGAGKCSRINARVLSMFLKAHGVYTVTAEVPISKLSCLTPFILKNIMLIITINKTEFALLRNMPVESIQVKLQTLKGNKKVNIITRGIKDVDTNELLTKIYKGGKVIL